MELYTNYVPQSWHHDIKNLFSDLFNKKWFSIFGLPEQLNISSCTVKNHSRLRRGYCIAGLVVLANFQTPACLFSIRYQNSPDMLTNTSQANPAYLDTFYALTDEQQQRHKAIKDHIEYVSAWLSGAVDICPIVPRVDKPQGIVLPFVNLKNVAI